MIQVVFELVLVLATAIAAGLAWPAPGRSWWLLGFGSIGAAAFFGALHFAELDVDLIYDPLVAWARTGGLLALLLGAVSSFDRVVPPVGGVGVLLVAGGAHVLGLFLPLQGLVMALLLWLGIQAGHGRTIGLGIGTVVLTTVLGILWPEGLSMKAVDVGHIGLSVAMLSFGVAARAEAR